MRKDQVSDFLLERCHSPILSSQHITETEAINEIFFSIAWLS